MKNLSSERKILAYLADGMIILSTPSVRHGKPTAIYGDTLYSIYPPLLDNMVERDVLCTRLEGEIRLYCSDSSPDITVGRTECETLVPIGAPVIDGYLLYRLP